MPLRGARRHGMPEPREGFRAVGRVERPWGLRGEIKVLPLTDFPERFTPQAQLYVAREQRRVLRSRWQKGPESLECKALEKNFGAQSSKQAASKQSLFVCLQNP